LASKKCPNCRLLNLDTATRCDCGYDFPSGEMKESYLSQVPAGSDNHSENPTQNLPRLILKNSVIRIFRGMASYVILFIALIPYFTTPNKEGLLISILILLGIVALVLWDFKKGPGRIYPFMVDGFILLVFSAAIWGLTAGVFNYRSPRLFLGFLWFVFLEARKFYFGSKSSPPINNISRQVTP